MQFGLATGDVHLHYRVIGAIRAEEAANALKMLSVDERRRAARLRCPDDRFTLVAAHWLLRTALSRYAAVPASDWTFAANEYGKPLLCTPDIKTELRFNLTHTKGLIACAVCRGAEVGIDAASLGQGKDRLDFARRYFAATEAMSLEALDEGQRGACFIELWTLKEAYGKALGLGLAHPLDTCRFDLNGSSSIRFESQTSEPSLWQFALFAPTPAYRIALAMSGASEPPRRITTFAHESDTSTATLLRSSQSFEMMMTAF